MTTVTILVIDDDLGDRKLMRRMIAACDLNATVLEAGGPEEALTGQLPQIDMVFLDNLLPGCSGLDLLADMQHSFPAAAIVLMTGQGDEKTAKEAILRGALDYIPKRDLNPNALTRMIERGLETVRMRQVIAEHRQELETFANVLVHDLRAPLATVVGMVDLIEEAARAGDTDDLLDEIAMTRKAALNMVELIASLAAHVRNDHKLDFQTVPLRDVLADALLALTTTIAEAGARVTSELPDITVLCIRPQVAQLLQNLVANSIKYRGDAPPEVAITSDTTAEGALRISVSDNGIGIPPESRREIFKPFHRLRNSKVLGAGLGLATCKKIVTRHGGRIWCDTQYEGGTRVSFTLPDALAAAQDAADDAPATSLAKQA